MYIWKEKWDALKKHTQWDAIKQFGKLEVLKPSGIALAVVPIIAQAYFFLHETISSALSQTGSESLRILLQRMLEVLAHFQLPRSLLYAYISAWAFLLAKIFYNLACPDAIKSYEHSDGNRYTLEHKQAKDDLLTLLYKVYQKSPQTVAQPFGIQKYDLPQSSFQEHFKEQAPNTLFPAARSCIQDLYPIRRFFCLTLYLVGFGMLLEIFLLNTYRVATFLWN